MGSLLPSSSIFPKVLYIKDSHLNTKWPSSLSSSDIKQFPTIPYQLYSHISSLLIYVEYYIKPLKPHICTQALGERPRLLSIGNLDSPVYLNNRALSESKAKYKVTFTNESIYEENEVGVKLISSEIFDNEDLENEDFGRSSFDMEIDISENHDTPEEAKISLYMLSCEKIREISLFESSNNIEFKTLVENWKN